MIRKSELLKALGLTAMSFLLIFMGAVGNQASLGSLFIFMIPAAVPLLPLRRLLGRSPYFLVGAGLAFLFLGMKLQTAAFTFLALIALVGVYVEFRKRHYTVNEAAGFALIASAVALCAGFFVWQKNTGAKWFQILEQGVATTLANAFSGIPKDQVPVSAIEIVQQIPSIVIICSILALFAAVLFEKPLIRLFGLKMAPLNFGLLQGFRAPGFMIWLFIGALSATFLKFDITWLKVTGTNLLNVLIAIYFIQGLGVVTHYFTTFRVGMVWRVLWLTIMIFQLAIVVSLLGVIDYWIDFRTKFAKKATQLRKTS